MSESFGHVPGSGSCVRFGFSRNAFSGFSIVIVSIYTVVSEDSSFYNLTRVCFVYLGHSDHVEMKSKDGYHFLRKHSQTKGFLSTNTI